METSQSVNSLVANQSLMNWNSAKFSFKTLMHTNIYKYLTMKNAKKKIALLIFLRHNKKKRMQLFKNSELLINSI